MSHQIFLNHYINPILAIFFLPFSQSWLLFAGGLVAAFLLTLAVLLADLAIAVHGLHAQQAPWRCLKIWCQVAQDSSGYQYLITDWWFGTWFVFFHIGKNTPTWRIFFRGVETTNQIILIFMRCLDRMIDYSWYSLNLRLPYEYYSWPIFHENTIDQSYGGACKPLINTHSCAGSYSH